MTAANFDMRKAEFRLPLQGGGNISYEEAFSPFIIFSIEKRQESYILLPKQDQENLKGIVIVANNSAIRICQHRGWPKMFVSNVHQILDCKDQKNFLKIDYEKIPIEVQYSIVSNLIKQIQYKTI